METKNPFTEIPLTDDVSGDTIQFIRDLTACFPIGCACFQTFFDRHGGVADSIVIGVSPPLEQLCGRGGEPLSGKKISEAFSPFGAELCRRLSQACADLCRGEEKAVPFPVRLLSRTYQASLFYISATLTFFLIDERRAPVSPLLPPRQAPGGAAPATLRKENRTTQGHSSHMVLYCRRIAEKLGLDEKATSDLVLLSMLHDIGKIGIRHEILNKPGSLTAKERQEMELHPEIGYQITRNIPELSQVSEYILSHHERWDGTGYPAHLRAEEIPLASRIIAVADAYDVMISGRIYQKPRTRTEAIAELKRCAKTQFDPGIVGIFIELLEQEETLR